MINSLIGRTLGITRLENRINSFPKMLKAKRNSRDSLESWLPFTLRATYLALLVCISLLLLGIIELLRQITHHNQGVFFVEDTSQIPSALFFAYNYIPAISAVVYSTLWILIDLDVKRLEPYFQISKRAGVPMSVLFIDYAFEQMFFVPFNAIKRKHWVVALVSINTLLTSTILPALLNGLFSITPTTVIDMMQFNAWNSLDNITNQTDVSRIYASGEVLNQARSISSAGAALPKFVTANYAISPFGSLKNDHTIDHETWTTENSVFWAQPYCVEVPSFSSGFKGKLSSIRG